MSSLRGRLLVRLIESRVGTLEQRMKYLESGGTTGPKPGKPLQLPESVSLRLQCLSESNIEWVTKDTPTRVVYWIHGGGFFLPLLDAYRKLAAEMVQTHAGLAVVLSDYRVMPDHKYPSALDDAMEGYRAILAEGISPSDILVMGDSAGGNLGMALMLLLKEQGEPLPAGIVLMSPWLDMAGESPSLFSNAYRDPILGYQKKETMRPDYPPIPPNHVPDGLDRKDPLVSPVYGDVTGFPPMLIQVGEREILLDDSRRMAEKAEKQGVHTVLEEYPGMVHCFQIIFPGWIPESGQARQSIDAYIRKRLYEEEL